MKKPKMPKVNSSKAVWERYFQKLKDFQTKVAVMKKAKDLRNKL